MSRLLQRSALPAAMLATVSLGTQWHTLVSRNVPEPYLDEFFHVPQAQAYCRGDYTWDPKITTPPGLYLVAKLMKPFIGCDTSSLRFLNVSALCLMCPLVYSILRVLRSPAAKTSNKGRSTDHRLATGDPTTLLDANTALNIALFPPLFFFSALFYTDVMSTFAVLFSYSTFLRKSSSHGNLYDVLNAIVIGVIALLFRQTNIFWIAVFPAGLNLVDALKSNSILLKRSDSSNVGALLRQSWEEGLVYDCPIQDAHLQDYVVLLLSMGLAVLRKPALVLKVALPYLVLILLFSAFVAWNGSVVLGDKSAHTATIHIPQMLYMWPYIAFFSSPLMLRPLFQILATFVPARFIEHPTRTGFSNRTPKYHGFLLPCVFMVGAFAAVHLNTIIHPYTLADNRHYVFYVFAIFRRHPALRYLVVPIYYTCAWLSWQCIAGTPNSGEALRRRRENARPTSDEIGCSPCQISFITIWLITTGLSVITAPLVEPRYFIVPWIIWRLHVPSRPASLKTSRSFAVNGYDVRLGLETVWLLAINAAIIYLFVYRGFTWPSEPGKTQRFLW